MVQTGEITFFFFKLSIFATLYGHFFAVLASSSEAYSLE
jgi:hypothetical protein